MNQYHFDRDITPELARSRTNAEYFIRGEIVAISNAVMGNYVEVLAAACELNRLGFELFGELDNDFKDFAGICSEVDDLPIGKERENWDPDALAQKENEVRRLAAMYSEVVRKACKRLLTRLGPYAPSLFE
jgi:hypothetical protein